MNAAEYRSWVLRLAEHKPWSRSFDAAYNYMIPAGVSMEDRVQIAEDARKLYRERAAKKFLDGYDDPWGPTGRYGGKLTNWMVQSRAGVSVDENRRSAVEQAMRGLAAYGNTFIKFNTEGEKQMDKKIDWHKPLRAFKTPGHEVVDAKVYTYKSGRQRVVWVDERVYPVDDQGRAMADVDYATNWVKKGQQIVENVPEEKFVLGLERKIDGTYVLYNGAVTGTDTDVWGAAVLARTQRESWWIVDTRKPAEPPKAIVHDPEDYVTIWSSRGKTQVSDYVMTKAKAEAYVSEPGEQVVRVRTTPAPVDTSRYIQLYRPTIGRGPWSIDQREANGGNGQEYAWEHTLKTGHCGNEYAHIKVRD